MSHSNFISVHNYKPSQGNQLTLIKLVVDAVFPQSLNTFNNSKQLRILFGNLPVATKVSRVLESDLLELGLHDSRFINSLCVTAVAPSYQSTQWLNHRVPLTIQALDSTKLLDSLEFGYFDYLVTSTPVNKSSYLQFNNSLNSQTSTSYTPFTLASSFSSQPTTSASIQIPVTPTSPSHQPTSTSPTSPTLPSTISTTTAISDQHNQPPLIRTSQLPTSPTGESLSPDENKATLLLHGNLQDMATSWTQEEWFNKRRLVQFWRRQDGPIVHATFRPITQSEYNQESVVISCIFREDKNECFVTSVDAIYLLEALVGIRFSVEEKNRIRRNLEGFRPITVSKTKSESENFFKLIMSFPNPKPRNIEKDVKVFPWSILSEALKKIIGKYSANYDFDIGSQHHEQPLQQIVSPSTSTTSAIPLGSPTSLYEFNTSPSRQRNVGRTTLVDSFKTDDDDEPDDNYSQPPRAAYLNSLRENPEFK